MGEDDRVFARRLRKMEIAAHAFAGGEMNADGFVRAHDCSTIPLEWPLNWPLATSARTIFIFFIAFIVVHVTLVGACGSCPVSTMTLKAGVERIIMDRVPGVTEVTTE